MGGSKVKPKVKAKARVAKTKVAKAKGDRRYFRKLRSKKDVKMSETEMMELHIP